ncbi:MAG: peptide deformylase [Nitrospirota bacterium]|jgi:peptide deformylase
MAVLEIKKYPDNILRIKAEPVRKIDSTILSLIDDMTETMYAAPGVGLAATQVGVSLRIMVVDVGLKEEGSGLIVLINPEIISVHGEIEEEEGCLSVPDYKAQIKRAEIITVRGLNKEGREIEIESTSLLARVIQHEIDHLNGVLIIDRMSPIKRELFKKKFRKVLKLMAH